MLKVAGQSLLSHSNWGNQDTIGQRPVSYFECVMTVVPNILDLLNIFSSKAIFEVYADRWFCPIAPLKSSSNFLYNWPHSWGFPKISASHPSWQRWSSRKGHTAPGWGLGLECYDPVIHNTVCDASSAICLWGTSLRWYVHKHNINNEYDNNRALLFDCSIPLF